MILLRNARLTNREGLYEIACDTTIKSITRIAADVCDPENYERPVHLDVASRTIDCNGNVVLPSLSAPHLHLDKSFLLSHCDANLKTGDFKEALSVTASAKRNFTTQDLLIRGHRLLRQCVKLGVTSARCHVEVDPTVNHSCLDVALQLKAFYAKSIDVQVAVFAQDPIFTADDQDGRRMKDLLISAVQKPGVEVVGSAPYVDSKERAMDNAKFIVGLALKHHLHLDFHMDYDLDPDTPAMVFEVLKYLKMAWEHSSKSITLGHVTKLTLFDDAQLRDLKRAVSQIKAPVNLVGLPTSDMHMMGRDERCRPRGTLQCADMVKKWDFNCSASINNCGNSFTPMSSGDPLAMNLPVVYQKAAQKDLQLLYELVSSRGRVAMGLRGIPLQLEEGCSSDLVILASTNSTTEAMTNGERDRTVLKVSSIPSRRHVRDARRLTSKAGALVSHTFSVSPALGQWETS